MHVRFSALVRFLLVPALLLSMLSCSCGVSAAAPSPHGGCMSDELMKRSSPLPSVVITPPPHTAMEDAPNAFAFALSNEWEPLRITVSGKDLYDPTKYCIKEDVGYTKKVKRTNMKGEEVKCTFHDVLTPEAITILTTEVLPRAIKLHTDRLLVQRSQVPWKVPSFAPGDVCAHFTVPETHRNPGLRDTDMILYVSAAPLRTEGSAKSLAWAVPCAQLSGRPVAGAMNFAADQIALSRHTVRITAHELAHVLGFLVSYMQAKNMVEKIEVRQKTAASVVSSTETKAKAQQHYGCTTAKGMALQTGDSDQPQSHWSRRNAMDELMAPLTRNEDAFLGLYTALTLAVFADLGYYKAKFELAEPMSWGKDATCKFLDEPCVKSGVSQFPGAFCATQNFEQQACSSDRIGVGKCSLLTRVASIPEQFRYFENAAHGGDADLFTDYCPVIGRQRGRFCANTETGFGSRITGSVRGENSWCLDGASLVAKNGNTSEPVDGVCAEVQCVVGGVNVKYSGDDAFHPCPEGQTISPKSSAFAGGSIKCPKFSEVCTVASDGSSLLGVLVPRESRGAEKPVAEEVGTTGVIDTHRPSERNRERLSDGTAALNSALLGPFLLILAAAICAG